MAETAPNLAGHEGQAFQAPQTEVAGTYDHLFDPTYSGGSVEAAARPLVETASQLPVSEADRVATNAAIEAAAVRPTGELTPVEIGQLTAHRGEKPTDDEIRHMGNARSAGKLTSVI